MPGTPMVGCDERMLTGGPFHVGLRCQASPFDMPVHVHGGYHEVVVCFAGTLRHEVNGRLRRQSAGDLTLVRETDAHALSSRSVHMTNIAFPVDWLDDVMAYLGEASRLGERLAAGDPLTARLDGRTTDRLAARLPAFAGRKADGDDIVALRRLLLDVLCDAFERGPASWPARAESLPAWLAEAMEELESLPPDQLSRARLQRCCHRSREHIARTFRRRLGTTPSAYLNELRLRHAEILLLDSTRGITDIAVACGFESLNYFFKLFRRRHGHSPRTYRLRNAPENS